MSLDFIICFYTNLIKDGYQQLSDFIKFQIFIIFMGNLINFKPMKTNYIKIILVLFLSFSFSFAFSQRTEENILDPDQIKVEEQTFKANLGTMKPRWICPYLRVRKNAEFESFSRIVLANYSNQKAKIKLHFYNAKGQMILTLTEEIPPKGSYYRDLDYAYFASNNREFHGHVILHTDSPAIFPSASYIDITGPFKIWYGDERREYFKNFSVTVLWHRLD